MTENQVYSIARQYVTSEVARAWKKELAEFVNHILDMRGGEEDGDESVSVTREQ